MILNDEPFQAPSLDAILERDIEILCFSPTAHLQTRVAHELVLPPGHLGPTMVQVFPQSKVRQNTKISFTKMNKNRNLQNRIRI
jgi:hypothetical protein